MRNDAAAPIRTADVGFGVSGKVFHAPLIAADPGYSLEVIVTAAPERAAEAARLYPEARIIPTPEALFALAADLDLVILAPHRLPTSTSPQRRSAAASTSWWTSRL